MIEQEKEARAYIEEKGGARAIRSLSVLSERLKEENQRQNLVAKGSLDHIWVRHFADSAQLLDHVPRETYGPWLDLGSGAGFPGLVLATLRPDIEFVLIESRRLRVEWLERMSSELGLENCHIEGCRLEQVTTVEAGIISARAFAPLAKLLRLSARFSTDDTRWVLPKGRSAAHEVQELPGRESKMFHVEQSLTDQDAGIVVGRGKVREKA
ncbi:16S rRNA (guanine(527)-N(7))-methyltransferase RsmG [Qipengyuania aquimaris]|uniref:16S rRNA (guanine(527)-N(7))-methyltransferase RsmG n=1 Tax=Qipengyuania aquimaris TaxID=255984 RepID=UPI001CD703E2|nr:16S rRNA (guanine(527)-N(7))-methyltransferase RsmG [Qipengyuania aquimaris]MCA0903462.1 16S rRNA (guanine(527)-N(7))-methyltransferase RsmG [Qipengyuania aquimaris]